MPPSSAVSSFEDSPRSVSRGQLRSSAGRLASAFPESCSVVSWGPRSSAGSSASPRLTIRSALLIPTPALSPISQWAQRCCEQQQKIPFSS